LGQKTATTQTGRDIARDGYPIKISEMIAMLPGVKYVERTSIHTKDNLIKCKEAVKKAFLNQINNVGFSLVEIIATCPTYSGESLKTLYENIENKVTKYYELGVIKDES